MTITMNEPRRAGRYEIETEPLSIRRVGTSPGFRATVGYLFAIVAMLATGPLILAFGFAGYMWGIFAICGLLTFNLLAATTYGLRPYFVRRPASVTLEDVPSGQQLLRVDRVSTSAAEVRDVIVQPLQSGVEHTTTTYGVFIVLVGRVVELDTTRNLPEALELAKPLREALGMAPHPDLSEPTLVTPAAGCLSVALGVVEALAAIGLLMRAIDFSGSTTLREAVLPTMAIVALDGIVHLVMRLTMGRAASGWVASRFPDALGAVAPSRWGTLGWTAMMLALCVTWVVLMLLSLGITLFD
ncbi:MAG: hypothetical protein ACE37F_03970 [Nannocystaceae bacterium]|nr:hypothetical protein [bacterium]